VPRGAGPPASVNTSTSMPSPARPSEHGRSGVNGVAERRQPTISVPPEMLMTGQRPPPMFSKNQRQEVSSHGSPVEPSTRSRDRSWPRGPRPSVTRMRSRTRVGEAANVTTRSRSSVRQSRSLSG